MAGVCELSFPRSHLNQGNEPKQTETKNIMKEGTIKLMADITSFYSHLVGQENAIKQRVNAWTAYVLGAHPKSAFVKGEAGLGKTALMRADAKCAKWCMEQRGEFGEVLYYKSAGELRKNGEDWKRFITTVLDSSTGSTFIYLDEFHELLPLLVQGAKVIQLLKGWTDKERGEFRSVSFGDEGTATRHASQIMFIVGTNFPAKIPDYQAIASRLGEIDLELYSIPQLCEIAVRMAKNAKLQIVENTVGTLARCGRGTARPIEKIIEKASELALIHDKRTISKADALEIMRENSLYPHGLKTLEVAMINEAQKGYISLATVATAQKVETKVVKDAACFLNYIGMIAINGAKFTASQEGRDFISAIKKLKFHVPEFKREEQEASA